MEYEKYADFIENFQESSLTKLTIEDQGFKISMEKGLPGELLSTFPGPGLQVFSTEPGLAPERGTKVNGKSAEDPGKVPETVATEEAKEEQNSGEPFHPITAPLVGVFYSAPSPEEPPFVEEGQKVEEGQVLCIIEAMKMMNELKSPVAGIVKSVNGKNGEMVEFGQVLFEVALC